MQAKASLKRSTVYKEVYLDHDKSKKQRTMESNLGLLVTQWPKTRSLCVCNSDTDILAICESHLSGSDQIDLDWFVWLGKNRQFEHVNAHTSSGGDSFLVRTNLLSNFEVSVLDETVDDILWVKMKSKTVLNIYSCVFGKRNYRVLVRVSVFVCVCVFLHDNSKRNRSRNTKLEYIVEYENSSDEYDIELRQIKVKVTVGVHKFFPFTTIQTVRSYSSTVVQARNLILSMYLHLILIYKIYKCRHA